MDKVRVGIIGLGKWGELHLEAYQSIPQVEIVAICDTNNKRMKELSSQYGVKNCYGTVQELIDKGNIDLVSVVTPEVNHYQTVLQVIDAGMHVVVEKPVSTKYEEATEMLKKARERNRLLFPGHLLRFENQYAQLHETIQKGDIGKPVHLHLKRSRRKSLFELYKRMHTVYVLSIHDIDLALWYAKSRVKKVKAHGQLIQNNSPKILTVFLEFENNVVAVIESNWMAPNNIGIEFLDYAEVIGETGTIELNQKNPTLDIWTDQERYVPDTQIHHKMNGRWNGALKEELHYICMCIQNNKDYGYLSFEDAIEGIRIADAIKKSIETNESVVL